MKQMNRVLARVAPLMIGAVLSLVAIAPAGAHGDYTTSVPEKGAVLNEVPPEIRVTLTEPPTGDSKIVAKDPCGNTVTGVSVRNNDIIAEVSPEAHPGDWKVRWESISSVDGHSTTGTFSFTVEGEFDCTPEPIEETPAPSDGTPDPGPSPGATLAPTAATDDGSPSFPLVPTLFGSVVLIGIAFVTRRVAGG